MGTQRRCNRSSTASALTLNSFKQSSSTMGAVATVTNFVLAGLVLVIKYPFWLLKYGLFPSTRSRPSWTLRNQLLVNTLRWTMDLIVDVQVPFARDLDLPPVAANELKHSHQVMLEPLEDRYLQGIITESAREVGGLERISKFPQPKGAVGPRKIPAYWYAGTKQQKEEDLPDLKNGEEDLVVLFLHGGAYKFGTSHESDSTSGIAKTLLEKTAATRVLSVDYRLAHIAPFPAALIDALTGYAYLVDTCGIPSSRIVIAGDSAGGNLTLALTRYLRDERVLGMPAAILLLSPWGDMTRSHWGKAASSVTNAKSDYVTGRLGNTAVAEFSAGHSSSFLYNPYLSPGGRFNIDPKSFDGFPHTYIVAGGAEMLLDEIKFLHRRMAESLGEDKVVYDEVADAPHDVYVWPKWGPEREKSVKKVGEWLERLFPAAAKAKAQLQPSARGAKKDL